MIHGPEVVPMRPRPRVAAPQKAPPVKVFTDAAVAQLNKLNAAARVVRACGLRILDQRLDGIQPLGCRPTIKIAAANKALMDKACPPSYLDTEATSIVHVLIDGVRVMWEVPR